MGKAVEMYQAELAERFKKAEKRREAKRLARAVGNGRVISMGRQGRMPSGWAKEMITMLRIMPRFATKRQRKLYNSWRRGEVGTKEFKAQMKKLIARKPPPAPDMGFTAEDVHEHHHHDHDGHHHHH